MSYIPYSSTVGSLMYTMVCTRPYIAHVVGTISRFLSNPGKEHWDAVKWILRYLKGTADMELCFGSGKPELVCYTDSDLGGNLDNSRSTSGYLITFAGGAISWQSRLQKCIALSTTEAEYIAITEGAKELLWMKEFMKDLDFEQSRFVLFCDNQSAIYLTKHSTFHSKSKHISRKYHWIRMAVKEKLFEVEKIHTDENPSDMLIKVVVVEKHEYCRTLAGMKLVLSSSA